MGPTIADGNGIGNGCTGDDDIVALDLGIGPDPFFVGARKREPFHLTVRAVSNQRLFIGFEGVGLVFGRQRFCQQPTGKVVVLKDGFSPLRPDSPVAVTTRVDLD